MVVGAPGGGRIPPAILQLMVHMLDYGMDPLDAERMPCIARSVTEKGWFTADQL
ncbi:MAG: gamma-glutamyltransferase [Gemmatimonadetes bacterium]|nr:gamma-glutamyltransferase [Gemmatimonadota bacterium]